MAAKLELPAVKNQILHSPTIAAVGPDGQLTVKPREVSVNSRRRETIRDGGSSPKGSSSATNSQLPIDSGNRTAKGAIESGQPAFLEEGPAIILQGLMEKFIFLKEKGGKAEAFKSLQKSFAMNAAILSPYFIPLKDLMNLIMELETFIGKSGEHVGKTPEQVLRGFLQTGFLNGTQIPSPYPETTETLDISPKTVSTVPVEG